MKQILPILFFAAMQFTACNQNPPVISEPEIMSVANKIFYGEDVTVKGHYIQFKADSVIFVQGKEERYIWRGTYCQHKDLVDCCFISSRTGDTTMCYAGVFDGGVLFMEHFYRERQN